MNDSECLNCTLEKSKEICDSCLYNTTERFTYGSMEGYSEYSDAFECDGDAMYLHEWD